MIEKFVVTIILSISFCYGQMLGPKAVLKNIEYDFGNIEQGKVVEFNFEISNSGDDVLRIDNVRASCGCTAAAPEKKELRPGESTQILVSFNSSGRIGSQQKYVYLTTNDPSSSEIKLKITGNILPQGSPTSNDKLPKIVFSENQYDFGIVKEGEIVSHTFKFSNKGKATLQIKDIKTSCGCTAALISDKEIPPGKQGTLKVELDTKNRQGRMSRTITVVSNDPEEPNKILTIYAEVTK